MEKQLLQQIRILKISVTLLSLAFASFFLFAFKNNMATKFHTIDVERINIIDSNGKLCMVLANKKNIPPAVTNGRILDDSKKERSAGFLLYNDDGDEVGGYLFGNWGVHFSMDQYKRDQIVYSQVINDSEGNPATAGYWVSPQANAMTSDVMDRVYDSLYAISDKDERKKALKRFRESIDSHPKAFMGKSRDDNTGLFLFDKNTNTRMRAYVDTLGNPKLEFLDEKGNVFFSLPDKK